MRRWLNLENLIYLTIALLPAYLLRFKFLGISTNALEALIALILLLWIAEKRGRIFSGMKIIDRRYAVFVSLIFLGLLIATLANKNYLIGLGIIKGWFLLPVVFFVVAKDTLVREKIVNIFTALYVSGFLLALAALFYLFFGKLTFDGRLQAFFNSPNYLAMYLSPGIIVNLFLLLSVVEKVNFYGQKIQNENLKNKNDNAKLKIVFFMASLSVLLFAIYKTYSYSAWMALTVSLAVVYMFKKKISIKIFFLAAFSIIFIFLSQINNKKFADFVNFDERSSLSSRVMIWKSAGKMLENNWMLGIGPGNFQTLYLEYQKYYPPYLEWAVPHPHNMYLAFWLYGGLMGLIGFLGLVYLFIEDIFARMNDKKTPRQGVSTEILYISLGIMLYILVHGLIDTTYFKNDLSVVFWLCFLVL